jgi:pimeloyl-ACP methyl ester carboxylesterase
MGFSMGGWSALLYGVRHPDLYSFIGSISGVPDTSITDDPAGGAALEAIGYLRSQGYGMLPTRDPVYNDEFNSAYLASNMAGAGDTLFFSVGDGCLSLPADLVAPDCVAHPALLNPAGAAAEELIVSTNKPGQRAFAAAGVPFTSMESPGIHGANNHTVYADYIVPLANATFSAPHPAPATFTYTSADATFHIWGYTVAPDPGFPAFTTLRSARSDGTAFTVAGTRPVAVTTPSTFTPGGGYRLTTQCVGGNPTTQLETAGADGRLRIVVPTSSAQPSCSVRIGT